MHSKCDDFLIGMFLTILLAVAFSNCSICPFSGLFFMNVLFPSRSNYNDFDDDELKKKAPVISTWLKLICQALSYHVICLFNFHN